MKFDERQFINKVNLINKLRAKVIALEERVAELEQYISKPLFKEGDLVNVSGIQDEKFIVDSLVCYDVSYPIYNLRGREDKERFETIPEVDIYT